MKADKFSSTALVVALGHLYAARHPSTRHLVSPETAALTRELLLRVNPGLDKLISRMEKTWFRAGADLLQRMTIPGICAHYALRKLRLEEAVRDWLERGMGRVMVLGAGFDTLMYRLHRRYPEVDFIEMDHPATQAAKTKALEALDSPERNLSFASLDLVQEDPPASDIPTLYLAEGLLMYLPPERVRRLFARLRTGATSGGIAFTFMENREAGGIRFRGQSRLIDYWLAWKGEPFTWGAGEDRVREMLREAGYGSMSFAHAADLKREYGCPAEFQSASGESICLAEMATVASPSPLRSGSVESLNVV